MRILCLTPWFPNHPQDQQGNFIYDSVTALMAQGHDVTVLVTRAWRPTVAGRLNPRWQTAPIQLHHFPEPLQLYTCRHFSLPRHYGSMLTFWHYKKITVPLIKQLIKQHHIQLIHAQTEFAGIAAVEAGQALNIPTVVTLHGVSTEQKLYRGRTRKQLFEEPLTKADRVVLVGKPLIDFARQFVKNADHFRLIQNGFRQHAAHQLSHQKTWHAHETRFISVSNLEEGKGIDLNLHALHALNQQGIWNWTYQIVGDGSERVRLQALCQTLQLDRQVCFTGALTHDQVYQQLADAEVFMLPSYREAFGVAYLEAMSCGLLAIGVQGQGPQAFIEHGHTGYLVQPKDIQSLVDALSMVCRNKNKAKAIAEAGQAHVHQFYTWQHHAQQLTVLYQELIKET